MLSDLLVTETCLLACLFVHTRCCTAHIVLALHRNFARLVPALAPVLCLPVPAGSAVPTASSVTAYFQQQMSICQLLQVLCERLLSVLDCRLLERRWTQLSQCWHP